MEPPTTLAAHARRHRTRMVILLGALSAFGPLSIDMYLPGLPALGDDLHAGAVPAQLTITTCLAGLALGQLVAGPLSDRFGRRRPLMIGVGLWGASAVLCAAAPTVGVLIALRLIMGFAGAAGIVISRAVVRDLYGGSELARFFSALLLVNGLAPIVAPLLGGQLLAITDWRGVFGVLAGAGLVLFAMAALGLPESLPPAARRTGGVGETLRTFRRLLSDRVFMGHVLACGLAFAAMFAYIAGSPFVLQDIYGVSPQVFSVLFSVNALGLVTLAQISGRLVGRLGPRRLLGYGLTMNAVGGIAVLCVVAAGGVGVGAMAAALFVTVSAMGLVFPNAAALAMADHPQDAGSASAFLGVLQFFIGALAAPLVGVAGQHTAWPMALVIATCALGAVASLTLLARERPAVAEAL
jgi:DHA1 family bicyclomycin/chloramphenicol resistance-like MFS transporter